MRSGAESLWPPHPAGGCDHHRDQRLMLGILRTDSPAGVRRRMFETAYEAYQRMAAAVRPGAAVREIIRAASVIGERGYRIYDDLVHGYGGDIHPPVIDRSCCDYWPWDEARPAPEGRRVEQNMA